MKKFIALLIVFIMAVNLTAAARSSGFYGPGEITVEAQNGYFFDYDNAILVDNHRTIIEFNYDEFYAGSVLYLPIMVHVNQTGVAALVTENMWRTDNVGVSSKVLRGREFVEEIEVVDGRRERINGLPATRFVKIPLVGHYESFGMDEILMEFVLSVHGVGELASRINFTGFIRNRSVLVNRSSAFPVGYPTAVQVSPIFNGEVTFDFGENIRYTNRVSARDRYIFSLSRVPDPDIVKMNTERNTYMEFYNFRGTLDTFRTWGDLEIPVPRDKLSRGRNQPEELYVYRITGESLESMGPDEVSFHSRTNKLTISTNTLENYVVSNVALFRDFENEDNIDILRTGYAQTPEDEYAEEEFEDIPDEEFDDGFVPPPPGGPVGDLFLSSSATAQAALDGLDGDEGEDKDEDKSGGDVTVESEFFGNRFDSTPISAANEGSAVNPSTSDNRHIPFAVLLMLVSCAVIILSRLKGCVSNGR